MTVDDSLSLSCQRYLRGEMTESEQTEFEERFMTDNGVYQALRIAIAEMAERYVQQAMSPAEQERFEQHLLPLQNIRRETAFTRAIMNYAARQPDDGELPQE